VQKAASGRDVADIFFEASRAFFMLVITPVFQVHTPGKAASIKGPF
jgi:hypothetical protein